MISIVIVSYNSAAIITQCMDELLSSGKYHIIVIDNNSSDGSADVLQRRYPNIDVIALKQNIGYGRAANMGLQKIETHYAFLINPDLRVKPANISELIQYIDQKNLGAALYAPAVKTADFLQQGPVEKDWVIGAAMLFDMIRMKNIGFFDENIFLFYEEKDLCHRIHNANEIIILCTDFYFDHLKGQCCATNPNVDFIKNWHVGWSSMYYHNKHNLDHGKHSKNRILLKYLIKSLFSISASKRQKFKIRSQGVKAYLKDQKAFTKNGCAQCSQLLKNG